MLLEMAVLASDLALSPVTPEILAAGSFDAAPCSCSKTSRRTGTWASNRRRCLLINRVHPVSANA